MYKIRSLENEFYTFHVQNDLFVDWIIISCPKRSVCGFNHNISLLSIPLLKKRKSRKPEFSAERLLTGEYAMYIFIITLSTFLIIVKEIVMLGKKRWKRSDSIIWSWKIQINSEPNRFSADSKSWGFFFEACNSTEDSGLSD
jgi:hypothetical protein